MTREDIKSTPLWGLYEKGRNYHRLMGVYADTDKNYRMYNGNQWEGAKLGGVEPVQKNFIRPIVKYKLAVIHNNLYAIVYSNQNYDNPEFAKEAEKIIDMLNRYAARVWEAEKMDKKGRKITKDAAINDEGILYIDYDKEKNMPINEVIKKCDVYYANENDEDIQSQPYILIRKRMPVVNAIDLALRLGLNEADVGYIVGDKDNFEESGEAAKYELDDMVTIIYKMYKQNGTVHFSAGSKYITFCEDINVGISLYPMAHFTWEEREGSARGEGEVRSLIPNQIEVNKTEMRRVLTVKGQAYPQKIADKNRITNPSQLDKVGGTIYVNGTTVDDVKKLVGTLPPAQMSTDVKQLQDDLIQMSRELAGAGDIATGQINPENASGKAILAVQQASQSPMTEQKEAYKDFIEDVAKIWLEYLIAYAKDGISLYEEVENTTTGETELQVVKVQQVTLKALQASVKVDVTPKSVYDRFAKEQTIENLLTAGYFNAEKVNELEVYAKVLDDDSVAPKREIMEAIAYIKDTQQKIAQIQMRQQMISQQVQRFLAEGPDAQAQQMMQMQNAPVQGVDDSNPDDN